MNIVFVYFGKPFMKVRVRLPIELTREVFGLDQIDSNETCYDDQLRLHKPNGNSHSRVK